MCSITQCYSFSYRWNVFYNGVGFGVKVILKKIQEMQMERIKASEPVSVEVSSPTLEATFEEKSPVIKDESKEVVLEAGNDESCPGTTDDESSSVRSKSLALLKRLKVSEGFFSLKTLLELALARLSAASSNLEGRAIRFGALAALFLFVFLRHRHSLRRYSLTCLISQS